MILKIWWWHEVNWEDSIQLKKVGTSLTVQWLRIHFAGQGMQVRSLVRELRSHSLWSLSPHTTATEPACSRAQAPQLDSLHPAATEARVLCSLCALQPVCYTSRAYVPQLLKPWARWSPHITARESVGGKIQHDATKILCAATKTPHSQMNK